LRYFEEQRATNTSLGYECARTDALASIKLQVGVEDYTERDFSAAVTDSERLSTGNVDEV